MKITYDDWYRRIGAYPVLRPMDGFPARGDPHTCFIGGCKSCGLDVIEMIRWTRWFMTCKGSWDVPSPMESYQVALRKAQAAAAGKPVSNKVTCKSLVKLPTLLSYLQEETYEDGSKRELASVAVFVERGWVKVALNDKDQRRSLYITSESLSGALEALEMAIQDDKGDWRPWNHNTKKK